MDSSTPMYKASEFQRLMMALSLAMGTLFSKDTKHASKAAGCEFADPSVSLSLGLVAFNICGRTGACCRTPMWGLHQATAINTAVNTIANGSLPVPIKKAQGDYTCRSGTIGFAVGGLELASTNMSALLQNHRGCLHKHVCSV
eukprot:3934644-Rhodomonas_salina.1